MNQNNKLTIVEANKTSDLSYDALSLCNHELEKGLKEFDILRKAYELIFENSQFFYEQLAIAFCTGSNETTA